MQQAACLWRSQQLKCQRHQTERSCCGESVQSRGQELPAQWSGRSASHLLLELGAAVHDNRGFCLCGCLLYTLSHQGLPRNGVRCEVWQATGSRHDDVHTVHMCASLLSLSGAACMLSRTVAEPPHGFLCSSSLLSISASVLSVCERLALQRTSRLLVVSQ